MDVKIIDSAAEFAALEGAWQALAVRSRAHPFQEFGWADAWMGTIGSRGGRRLHVATVREGPDLLAVLPLTLRRVNGVRVLEWIGAKVTDYCDALLDPQSDAGSLLRALWEGLCGQGGFDVIRLGQVRADAHANALLPEQRAWVETRECTHFLPITWENGQDWLQRLPSAHARDRIRRGLRSLAKLGLDFHVWQPGEPLEPLVEAVIEQKRGWLLAQKLDSFLLEPLGPEFLRAVAAAMAASGSLHLSVLRSGTGIVSSHFGFYRHGSMYYYIPTYDPAWSKQSVGSLLRDSLIMWACDHGASRFDMLRGEYQYKTRYGLSEERLRTLAVGRGLMGRAALSYYRWRHAARHADLTPGLSAGGGT